MPQFYHTVPCYGFRGCPFVMQLLVKDVARETLFVFVEYRSDQGRERLRLWPTDTYRAAESYSLYTARIPREHVQGERFSYRFCIGGTCTKIYSFVLKNVDVMRFWLRDEPFPVILPLYKGEHPQCSADAPCLRFVSFPRDLLQLLVRVWVQGEWQSFPAALNERGVWECRLSRQVAEYLGGRLRYFVQAIGRVYTASLGEERAPLSMPVVDEAGPLILSFSPSAGQRLSQDPPQISVAYRDASGVDVPASALYLDGRAIGKNAVWTSNGVSFLPQEALGGGEHTVEILLRDRHGNRTYQKSNFFLTSVGRKKPSARPFAFLRAAGFLTSVLAALRRIFSDKT